MNVWVCSRLRWQARKIPDTKGSSPGLFFCFDRLVKAVVKALPYRNTKVSLLVVSGCCHVAASAVIQVCCEPRTKRITPFFRVWKEHRGELGFKREIRNHTARRGALKAAPASWLAVVRKHTGLCGQPNRTFLAIYPRLSKEHPRLLTAFTGGEKS